MKNIDFKNFWQWKSLRVEGKKTFVVKEKLKLLKKEIIRWNKEVYGWLDLNIENIVNDLNDFVEVVGRGD